MPESRLVDEGEAQRQLYLVLEPVRKWGEQSHREQRVQAGSRTAGDDELTEPYHLSHVVAVHLGVALDHLLALRALFVDAQALHMAAPFTLTRSALENAAQALWLLTPDDQTTRVRRRMQLAVQDARERDRVAVLLGEGREGRQALPARYDRLAGIASRAGIPRDVVLGRATAVGTVVAAADDVPQLAGLHMEAIWRICSGYAHGASWSLISAGARERVGPGTEDDPVSTYSVTADGRTLLTVTKAAVASLREARVQHDRHRLRWRHHSAP